MSIETSAIRRPGLKAVVELPDVVVKFERTQDGEVHAVLRGGSHFPLSAVVDGEAEFGKIGYGEWQ